MVKLKKKKKTWKARGSKPRVLKNLSKKAVDGSVHIRATLNNTIVTISDMKGNTIAWSSAGASGFKGARKGTPFAGQVAGENVGYAARERGIKRVEVITKGPGFGRESAIRGLYTAGMQVALICDVTPTTHNGCRPPKKRRV